MADWFYTSDGEQQGPVSAKELKALASSGQISPEDLVWKEGMEEWAPAGKVPRLFKSPASDPQPPQPPRVQSSPPTVTDDELLVSVRSGPPARRSGFVVDFLNKAKAVRLRKEVNGLKIRLRETLRGVGASVIESGSEGVDISNEKARLRELVNEMKLRSSKLEAIEGTGGTRSVERSLNEELVQLEAERDQVLEEIARESHRAGALEQSTSTKIEQLELMLEESRGKLDSVSPTTTSAQSTSESSARRFVKPLVAATLAGLAVCGLWFAWGFIAPMLGFGNQLAGFEASVPPNADFLQIMRRSEAAAESSLWMKIREKLDSKSDEDAPFEAEPEIGIVSGADDVEDVPVIVATVNEGEVETTRDAKKNYDSKEYESSEYWMQKNGPGAFHISGNHVYSVISSTSDDCEQAMEDLLDRISEDRASKAAKVLQEWLVYAPSDSHVIDLRTAFPSDTRRDGFKVISSLAPGNFEAGNSFSSVGSYLFPDESAQEHDEELKALLVAIELGEDAKVTEIYHFSSQGSAKDYSKLIERRLKSTRKKIEDDEINGDKLVLDLEKILEDLEVTHDGSVTTYTYTIPQSVILNAIRED